MLAELTQAIAVSVERCAYRAADLEERHREQPQASPTYIKLPLSHQHRAAQEGAQSRAATSIPYIHKAPVGPPTSGSSRRSPIASSYKPSLYTQSSCWTTHIGQLKKEPHREQPQAFPIYTKLLLEPPTSGSSRRSFCRVSPGGTASRQGVIYVF